MTLSPKTGLGRAGLTSGSAGLGGGSLSAAGGAAPAFTPGDLITGWGDWGDFREATGLFVDDAMADPVDTNLDLVGAVVGRKGVLTLTEASTSRKGEWLDGVGLQNVSNVVDLDVTGLTRNVNDGLFIYVAGYASTGTSNSSIRARLAAFSGTGTRLYADVCRAQATSSPATGGTGGVTDAYTTISAGDAPSYASVSVSSSDAYSRVNSGLGIDAPATGTWSGLNPFDKVSLWVAPTTGNKGVIIGWFISDTPLTAAQITQLNEYFGVTHGA